MLVDMLALKQGERVLDVGAGKGERAAELLVASPGVEVYAVDPNERRISEAKRDHPDVKCSVAGAEKLPYGDAYFDKAYSTMALHHFTDLDGALAEIARVLKRGGSYVVLEIEPHSLAGRIFRFFGRLAGERMNIMTEAQFLDRVRAAEWFEVAASVKPGSRYLVHLRRF